MLTVTSSSILFLLIFLALILKKYFNRNRNYWKERGVVTLKNELSLLQLLSIQDTEKEPDHLYYERLGAEKYGGLFEFGTPMLFIKDLEVAKLITIKEFHRFVDRRNFVNTDPLFSKSLFFLHTNEWRAIRTFLSPTYTSGKIKRMFHHFERCNEELKEFVLNNCPTVPGGGGYEIQVADLTGRWTADVIGAVAFGMKTDAMSDLDSYFFKSVKNTMNRRWLLKFKLFGYFPAIGNFFKMQSMDKDLSDFFQGILGKAIREREQNRDEKRDDFLQILADAKAENNTSLDFTHELALQQAFVFFFAGFDAVAGALGTTAYLLATNPKEQQKLWEEVKDAMVDGKISYEAVNNLEYLDMVISEALRMFPPVQRLERTCTHDYRIPDADFTIPKGMVVAIPVDQIHHDPKYYPDPHKFIPERFSAENNAQRTQMAYLPFGTGPRNCIGMRFAIVEMKMAMASLVYNFQLAPLEGVTPIPIKMEKHFGFTRIPVDLTLKFIPRPKS